MHPLQRKEKDCLNCGTLVQGRFCHVCGQENIIAHKSFLSLVTHFVYDVFHFDGKFFDTLKYLFSSPGKVAKEYTLGKRAKYLDPVRMYLFTSAIFFLVFFSLNQTRIDFNSKENLILDLGDRMELAMVLSDRARKFPNDSAIRKQMESLLDSTKQIRLIAYHGNDSSSAVQFRGSWFILNAREDTFGLLNGEPKNWITRKLSSKSEEFKNQYKGNYDEGANKLYSSFLRRLPYVFFLSLPFFAGILSLISSKKENLLYSDHAVFTLYLYVFTFILLLLGLSLNFFEKLSGWGIFRWLITGLSILWPLHLLLSIQRFYSISYTRAVARLVVLCILAFFVMLLLFLVFILILFI